MIVTVAVSALWVSLLNLMGSIICHNIRESYPQSEDVQFGRSVIPTGRYKPTNCQSAWHVISYNR